VHGGADSFRAVSPVAIEWLAEVPAPGARQRRFTLSRDGRSVPGVLWTPRDGTGPWPLVLIGHGGSGSKDEDYVVRLGRGLATRHQVAAAAIDGPVHGDRRSEPHATPHLVIAQFAQLWSGDGDAMTDAMVADWRAVLDALLELPELRTGTVGWWGVSMGTIIGLPVVAAEPRINAAVLGLMGLTGPTRARIERDAPRVRCPVLFLVQWDDEMFHRDDAFALWEALGTADRRLHVHPGPHGALPSEAFEASVDFLVARLRTPIPG
jgi:dienelactone hydrolase